jgi:type VI secretion system protein VasD
MVAKRLRIARWLTSWATLFLVLAAGALGASCSHPPPPRASGPATSAAPGEPPPPPCTSPEPLRLTLEASRLINPGERGEALPVLVRLYQLKATSKFQEASLDELLDRDKEVLGAEVAGTSEVTVNPGDRLQPAITRSPEAGFLAAVALFRKPAGGSWRVIAKLPLADADHCHQGGTQGEPSPGGVVRMFVDENRIELR